MKYTITGDNLQFVNVQLEPGEELMSTSGSMSYMTGNVRMEAKMEGGGHTVCRLGRECEGQVEPVGEPFARLGGTKQ